MLINVVDLRGNCLRKRKKMDPGKSFLCFGSNHKLQRELHFCPLFKHLAIKKGPLLTRWRNQQENTCTVPTVYFSLPDCSHRQHCNYCFHRNLFWILRRRRIVPKTQKSGTRGAFFSSCCAATARSYRFLSVTVRVRSLVVIIRLEIQKKNRIQKKSRNGFYSASLKNGSGLLHHPSLYPFFERKK